MWLTLFRKKERSGTVALLKKIRAATLIETLIASGIVLIVFTIGSLSLNNVFQSVVKHNESPFQNKVKELTYLAKNQALELPFYEDTPTWDIAIEKIDSRIQIEARYKPTEETTIELLDGED